MAGQQQQFSPVWQLGFMGLQMLPGILGDIKGKKRASRRALVPILARIMMLRGVDPAQLVPAIEAIIAEAVGGDDELMGAVKATYKAATAKPKPAASIWD